MKLNKGAQSKSAKAKQPRPIAEFATQSWGAGDLSFSPDSRTLAAAMPKKVGLGLIDTKTWRARASLADVTALSFAMEFSPDGKAFIVFSGKEQPCQCWETSSGRLKWALRPGSNSAAFSPNSRLVAASRAKEVLLCRADSGQVVKQMAAHKSSVDQVAFSSDGNRLFSVAQSQVHLWDGRNGKHVALVQEKLGEVNAAVFSPNSRLLALASKGIIRLYDLDGTNQHEFQAHDSTIWDLQFTSDSKRMITISGVGSDESLRIWDFPSCRELHKIQFMPEASSEQIAISANNKIMAVPFDYPDYGVRLWSIASAKLVGVVGFKHKLNRQFNTPTAPNRVALSPDGKWLAVVSDDAKTRVWRMSSVLQAGAV